MNKQWPYTTGGIPDEYFIRGSVPMTKEEIRTLSLSKLRLESKDVLVDIGAGTGSMSIEAGLKLKEGKVFAIERNPEGVELIKKNTMKFGLENIEIIHGSAPNHLLTLPKVDKVFIGGTGGHMIPILDWMDQQLIQGGRMVMNFITLENLSTSLEQLKLRKYQEIEIAHIAVSKGKKIQNMTMMMGSNPIYIISARKE